MKLRDYQEQGADFLYERDRAMILAPVGAGKTAITLTAMQAMINDGYASRFLVLAPKRVCTDVWPIEMPKWAANLSCRIAVGTPKDRAAALRSMAPVVVINYDNIQWLAEQDINVKINTNGGARTPDWWAQLAHPRVQIGFALDGLADTHGLHRQDVDWHRVIENARAYIQAGGRALWRFCPFDHNRHQEQQCRDLAASLGFEGFENIWDGRDRGPVYTRDGEFSHWIGDRDPERPVGRQGIGRTNYPAIKYY